MSTTQTQATRRPCWHTAMAGWAAALFLAATPSVHADDYPTKPIRILVGYAPGGAVDMVARAVGQSLSARLGQAVVIDNRPGAGTNIAVNALIHAPADGYTLMMTANALAANMALYQPAPFHAESDVAPIGLIGYVPVVIAANVNAPYANLSQLIAAAKARPGDIAFASPGNGSTPHMAVEFFENAAGIRLQHVPYRGGAPALTDVIGGQVPLIAINALEAQAQVRGGRLKVLAVLSAKRSAVFPDAPTIAESGFPHFEASVWYGLIAPAATPKPIIDQLHSAVEQALRTKDVQERMAAVGGETAPGSADDFGALIHSEHLRYERLVQQAHIQPD